MLIKPASKYLDRVLVLSREWIHGPLLQALLALRQPLVSMGNVNMWNSSNVCKAKERIYDAGSLTFRQPWLRCESILLLKTDWLYRRLAVVDDFRAKRVTKVTDDGVKARDSKIAHRCAKRGLRPKYHIIT
jgi:hypothetical protein